MKICILTYANINIRVGGGIDEGLRKNFQGSRAGNKGHLTIFRGLEDLILTL